MTRCDSRTVTVDKQELLAREFEAQRPRLGAVAYRMLGSLSEADDAVQEAWLRLSRVDAEELENVGAWLTTVVARLALNMLRSRNVRREEALDVRVPDPIIDRTDGTDPEHEALLADSVGLALLVVLETLNPLAVGDRLEELSDRWRRPNRRARPAPRSPA
jgi:DNA-directed RNA polymerase specialized sigma24 family protein